MEQREDRRDPGGRRLLTVRELIAMPHLGTRLLGGGAGLDRELSWAHTSDLPEPWNWLEGGELLLVTGVGLPEQADEQARLLEQLDAAGVAALSVAVNARGRVVTELMIATADRLGFPLLQTAYEVPYAWLTRAVADAEGTQAQEILRDTERLYGALRTATAAGRSGGLLVADVAASQGCRAQVVDPRDGSPVCADPARPVHADLVAEVAGPSTRGAGRARGRVRVRSGARHAVVVPLDDGGEALLVLEHEAGRAPGAVVLRHLATIAGAEVERAALERGREQDRAAQVLGRLLSGELPPEVGAVDVAAWGLTGPMRLVATDVPARDPGLRRLFRRLRESGVPAATFVDERAHLLLPATEEALQVVLDACDDDVRLGLSEDLRDLSRIAHAQREAHWALALARTGRERVVRHAENRLAAFLPASLGEAESVVERVLGPLVAYDRDNGTELLRSLRVFLEHDRSWQKAAPELFVHKQTLAYRMRKVEEVTGLDLHSTDDVAQLWLALRTLELIGR
ncbi:PucR family transcriptional regulator [Blastococcus sp. SYSU D00695]